jgi:hypothetical protein
MLVTPHRLMSPASSGLRPSLDISFLSGTLDDHVTFTRSTAAWIYDGTTLTPYAINAARATTSGLLIEEARTNLFLNSAVGVTQNCTVAASAYTLSFWGTGTITLTGTSTAGPLVGTGAANRVSLTFTPTAGSLTLTVSGSVQYVNLELGSFATSAIVTVGSTVVRAIDVATISTLTPWFNAAAGTILAEFAPLAPATATQTALSIDDATSNERFTLRTATGSLNAIVVDGGVVQASIALGSLSAGTTYKVAFAYAVNDFAASLNGGTVGTDVAGTLPTVTRVTLGSRLTAEPMSGFVRRLSYYSSRLPNATLIRIAT